MPRQRKRVGPGTAGRLLIATALAIAVFMLNQPVDAQTCGFNLGFAILHDQVPAVVGGCTENVHFDPLTGNGFQATTNGVLVWNKSGNVTSFTDGFQTWIDGPFGLQMRLNTQRFSWEPDPDGLEISPTPAPGEQCHTAGTRLTVLGSDAGAGNVVGTFGLTNALDVPCTFFGFVGAQLRDSDDNPLPTIVVRNGGPFVSQPEPELISVPAGESAQFLVHWTQVPSGTEVSCPASSSLAVILPDEFVPLEVPVIIRACGGGKLDVAAVT